MTIDLKITKAKALIAERERIDAELRELFAIDEAGSGGTASKRGRPRKEAAPASTADRALQNATTPPPTSGA